MLPLKVTLPLLVYDILINLGLTAFFCFIRHQYLRGRTFKQMMAVFSAALPVSHSKKLDTQENVLMLMMIKGKLGALAIIMPTVAKMKQSAGAKNTDRIPDNTSEATMNQERQGGKNGGIIFR